MELVCHSGGYWRVFNKKYIRYGVNNLNRVWSDGLSQGINGRGTHITFIPFDLVRNE